MEEHDDIAAATGEDELFRLLVDGVVDYAIFVVDPDGITRTWSDGAERLKGYRADEIIGHPFTIFYTPEDQADGIPQRMLERARREGHVEGEGWRVRRDGTRFWADVVLTPLHDASGELVGFAKVTRDRTDAHRATEASERAIEQQRRSIVQLESLDAWRREFVSSVVHDLATPAMAISGFAELLQSGKVDDEQSAYAVERILSNARALGRLLERLRTDAMLDSGRLRIDPELVRPDELTAEVVADLAPLLGDRQVSIEASDVSVWADHDALDRILHNLLANAARHTPPGTAIQVSTRHGDEGTVIEVADSGEGIPPDVRPHVFERFVRGDGSGTGLGLAIVHGLVELHGGRVEVDSTPGEGATFRVLLPDAPAGRAA